MGIKSLPFLKVCFLVTIYIYIWCHHLNHIGNFGKNKIFMIGKYGKFGDFFKMLEDPHLPLHFPEPF